MLNHNLKMLQIIADGEISEKDIEDTIMELHKLKMQVRYERRKRYVDNLSEAVRQQLIDDSIDTYKKVWEKRDEMH